MSTIAVIQTLPQELQFPMLKLIDGVKKELNAELAVRRQDFDELMKAVRELTEAQQHTEQRVGRLETALAELAEAQRNTEQRVGRLETALAELAEAQKRTEKRLEELAEAQRNTEQRVGRLETALAELAEAQKRTEKRLEELAEAQKRTEKRLEELAEAQRNTEQRVSRLETALAELAEAQRETEKAIRALTERQSSLVGDQLERRYREKPYAYFGPVIRRARAVSIVDIEADLESRLSDPELDELMLLDVLVRGRAAQYPESPEVWLAVEVSASVDRADVERARRRAALLRKAGYLAIPTVAGERATRGGAQAAREQNVFLVQDGRKEFWEAALAAALADGGGS